jgi:hypothetical protein
MLPHPDAMVALSVSCAPLVSHRVWRYAPWPRRRPARAPLSARPARWDRHSHVYRDKIGRGKRSQVQSGDTAELARGWRWRSPQPGSAPGVEAHRGAVPGGRHGAPSAHC